MKDTSTQWELHKPSGGHNDSVLNTWCPRQREKTSASWTHFSVLTPSKIKIKAKEEVQKQQGWIEFFFELRLDALLIHEKFAQGLNTKFHNCRIFLQLCLKMEAKLKRANSVCHLNRRTTTLIHLEVTEADSSQTRYISLLTKESGMEVTRIANKLRREEHVLP